jgi:hypothetical protein
MCHLQVRRFAQATAGAPADVLRPTLIISHVTIRLANFRLALIAAWYALFLRPP